MHDQRPKYKMQHVITETQKSSLMRAIIEQKIMLKLIKKM